METVFQHAPPIPSTATETVRVAQWDAMDAHQPTTVPLVLLDTSNPAQDVSSNVELEVTMTMLPQPAEDVTPHVLHAQVLTLVPHV